MQVGEEEEEDSDDSDEDDDGDDGEEMEGPEVVVQDEGPRQTSAEQLAGVRSSRSASGCSPAICAAFAQGSRRAEAGLLACAQLALAFGDEEDGGTTTAGNSSQTSDGPSPCPSPRHPSALS